MTHSIGKVSIEELARQGDLPRLLLRIGKNSFEGWDDALVGAISGRHRDIFEMALTRAPDREGRAAREAAKQGDFVAIRQIAKFGGNTDRAMLGAAEGQQIAMLKYLIDAGYHPGLFGDPFMYHVFRNGNEEMKRIVLKRFYNAKTIQLNVACQRGDLPLVNRLVGEGVRVTPDALQLACREGQLDVVKTILNPSTRGSRGALERAMEEAAKNGHLPVIDLLIGKGASVKSTDCLSYAAERGFLPIVRRIRETFSLKPQLVDDPTETLQPLRDLRSASYRTTTESLRRRHVGKRRLEDTPEEIQILDCVTYVDPEGRVDVEAIVNNHGAFPRNATDPPRRSGEDHGAFPRNATDPPRRSGEDRRWYWAFDKACKAGHSPVAEFILDTCEVPPDSDALYRGLGSACRNGHHSVVAMLIGRGSIDINLALITASQTADTDTIAMLIGRGADDLNGALAAAFAANERAAIEFLIGAGADDFNRALISACSGERLSFVRLAVANGGNAFKAALMIAIEREKITFIEYLIGCRADVVEEALEMACVRRRDIAFAYLIDVAPNANLPALLAMTRRHRGDDSCIPEILEDRLSTQ